MNSKPIAGVLSLIAVLALGCNADKPAQTEGKRGKPPSAAVRRVTALMVKGDQTSQAVVKLLQKVQSLDDLMKSKDRYMQLSWQNLKIMLEFFRSAMKLTDADFRVHLRLAATMNPAIAETKKKRLELGKHLQKIKGAKEYFAGLYAEHTAKITLQANQVKALLRQYNQRTSALSQVPSTKGMRPRPMH